jgi:two-component system, sensor histidine kinase and response regulator
MPDNSQLIAVVDDHADFAESIRHILEAHGYRVRCYGSRREALDRFAHEPPDLVISDLMMENADAGFSLAQAIKRDPALKDVPVIIVTAIARRLGMDFSPKGGSDLAAMHADVFLEKPIVPDQLLSSIDRMLASKRTV